MTRMTAYEMGITGEDLRHLRHHLSSEGLYIYTAVRMAYKDILNGEVDYALARLQTDLDKIRPTSNEAYEHITMLLEKKRKAEMSLNETPMSIENGGQQLKAAVAKWRTESTVVCKETLDQFEPSFEEGFMAAINMVREEWKENMLAFTGAFDNAVARRKHTDEYTEDCRQRMRAFNVMITSPHNEDEVQEAICSLNDIRSQL